ncbi:rotatin-like [Watersipora subatra]|uniref:rotatin-like n=1 Tax=Watersipora subatra TaxID=2589382 RepID=UPI00355B7AD7
MAEGVNIRGFIHKLDHNQEEVRLRALDNIINKLNYGIVQTIDLACDQFLISKLLQWFLRPSTPKKVECLQLLLKICEEEAGCKTLFTLGGLQFLQSLKPDIALDCHPLLDSILEKLFVKCHDIASNETSQHIVYRKEKDSTEITDVRFKSSHMIHPDSDLAITQSLSDRGDKFSQSHTKDRTRDETYHQQDWYSQALTTDESFGSSFLVVEFPWISLCPTDMHVLESTNQSLVSQDSQLMMSACDFLVDVMLFDFPAEIFLQRPLIVKTLLKLLTSLPDTPDVADISLSIVSTLIKLCDGLKARVNFHKDPVTFAPKQDIIALNPPSAINASDGTLVEQPSSSTGASEYSRPSVVGVSDEMEDQTQSTSLSSQEQRSSYRSVSVQMSPTLEELELQNMQLLLPDFCLGLHKSALGLLERCNNRLRLELLRLLLKLQRLLKLSITSALWVDTSQYARDLCEMFRREISNMARVAVKCHQLASTSSASNDIPESERRTNQALGLAQMRQTYILLSQLSLDLYTIIPQAICSDVLGSNERQLLYTICCDESLAQSISSMRKSSASLLKLVDVGSHDVFEAAKVVCESMTMFCAFQLNNDLSNKVR